MLINDTILADTTLIYSHGQDSPWQQFQARLWLVWFLCFSQTNLTHFVHLCSMSFLDKIKLRAFCSIRNWTLSCSGQCTHTAEKMWEVFHGQLWLPKGTSSNHTMRSREASKKRAQAPRVLFIENVSVHGIWLGNLFGNTTLNVQSPSMCVLPLTLFSNLQ